MGGGFLTIFDKPFCHDFKFWCRKPSVSLPLLVWRRCSRLVGQGTSRSSSAASSRAPGVRCRLDLWPLCVCPHRHMHHASIMSGMPVSPGALDGV